MTKDSTVLVTGASGFIAIHTIIQLLEKGYRVRGTLRSMDREAELRQNDQTELADRLKSLRAQIALMV